MNISFDQISFAALLTGAVVFFIKREFKSLDETKRTVASIESSVNMANEVKATVARMHDDHVRFFSDRGERATMWKTIDELKARIEHLERAKR